MLDPDPNQCQAASRVYRTLSSTAVGTVERRALHRPLSSRRRSPREITLRQSVPSHVRPVPPPSQAPLRSAIKCARALPNPCPVCVPSWWALPPAVAASSPTNSPAAREKTDAFIAACELHPLWNRGERRRTANRPRGHSIDSAGVSMNRRSLRAYPRSALRPRRCPGRRNALRPRRDGRQSSGRTRRATLPRSITTRRPPLAGATRRTELSVPNSSDECDRRRIDDPTFTVYDESVFVPTGRQRHRNRPDARFRRGYEWRPVGAPSIEVADDRDTPRRRIHQDEAYELHGVGTRRERHWTASRDAERRGRGDDGDPGRHSERRQRRRDENARREPPPSPEPIA